MPVDEEKPVHEHYHADEHLDENAPLVQGKEEKTANPSEQAKPVGNVLPASLTQK